MELNKVELSSRFHEILGEDKSVMSDHVRRERWNRWKELAVESGSNVGLEYWTSAEQCEGCRHKDDDWCTLQELPCTVNPILSFQLGVVGMACMGAGREPIDNKD